MKATDLTILINGLKLHFLDWGGSSGTTILLLHGFMGHAHVWDELASELAPSYRVLALDQRGHGDSEWSEGSHYSIDQHFADLCVFIDTVRIEKLVLLGHSMGGRNALLYTVCRPEKVARLILVDTRIENSPEAEAALERQVQSLPVRTRQLRVVEVVLKRLYPYLPASICSQIAKHGYRRDATGWLVPKYDRRMSRQLTAAGKTVPDPDLGQMINNVNCPILFVRGQESPFVSEREFHSLRRTLDGAVFQVISGSSHMPAQENLNSFKKVLLTFLADKI